MINLDIFYTKNMSLWLDLTIMFKTSPALLAQVIESRLAQNAGLPGKRQPPLERIRREVLNFNGVYLKKTTHTEIAKITKTLRF